MKGMFSMRDVLLTCENLHKNFKENRVLTAVNLTVYKNEIISLIGPSGCGKSTLLRCIAGLEKILSGEMMMNDCLITNVKAENRPVVLMFQQPLLFPHMTVLDNVTYGLKQQKVKKKQRIQEGMNMLEKVEMKKFAKRYPYELSGGQQQRVALARALVMKPSLLLLDEPFSSLDPTLRNAIRTWVCELLKEEKVTAIFVTHDKEEAMLLGDRVVIMKAGVIEQIGDSHTVYHYPANRFVAEFFSDGIIVNNAFIANEHIALFAVKQEALKKGLLPFEAVVTGEILKYGQTFYEVKSAFFNKKVMIHSTKRFQKGDIVFAAVHEENQQPFYVEMRKKEGEKNEEANRF
jgi:ABC-type Fe3+/spermidine/putrescine transport system ATPase subunit